LADFISRGCNGLRQVVGCLTQRLIAFKAFNDSRQGKAQVFPEPVSSEVVCVGVDPALFDFQPCGNILDCDEIHETSKVCHSIGAARVRPR
jgi:hypothetical protein